MTEETTGLRGPLSVLKNPGVCQLTGCGQWSPNRCLWEWSSDGTPIYCCLTCRLRRMSERVALNKDRGEPC